MKGQDILILLKLVCLQQSEAPKDSYSVRALSASTGVGKSEVSNSLSRSAAAGLMKHDRKSKVPKANIRALLEFIPNGLKYVFPAKAGDLVRGIPTAFAAPGLAGKLMSAGDYMPVWPDAHADTMGVKIDPLFKSVPEAVKQDQNLYDFLALADAIRLGNPRESQLAIQLLKERLQTS